MFRFRFDFNVHYVQNAMKHPLLSSLGLTVLAGTLFTPACGSLINIDYVSVGNASNAPDSTGYGAVSYAYRIGKYEVTISQYASFLNAKGSSNSAGIYNSSMASLGITQNGSSGSFTYTVTSGFENKPVACVSWYDAARFTNWLVNGQGSGSMETGAYTLNGAISGIITVNPGASVYLPTENEWYKAAYYNAGTSTYSLYPNGQNSITSADANFWPTPGYSTAVGSYSGDPSSYGTFDQGGNVWEWNDAVVGLSRGLRGGAWYDYDYYLASTSRTYNTPSFEYVNAGFRVASTMSAVPEITSTFTTLAIIASGLMLRRRTKCSDCLY